MKTNMRRVILLMLIGLVFSLLAVSISSACSTPGLLAGASWAPNVLVGVVTGGVPSVVTVAISNWNQTFRAAALCFAPSLIVTSSMGGPAIAMSMRLLPPQFAHQIQHAGLGGKPISPQPPIQADTSKQLP